jgi:hypothetical protein
MDARGEAVIVGGVQLCDDVRDPSLPSVGLYEIHPTDGSLSEVTDLSLDDRRALRRLVTSSSKPEQCPSFRTCHRQRRGASQVCGVEFAGWGARVGA